MALEIIRRVPSRSTNCTYVEVRCYCGNIFITRQSSIKNQHTKSCGCRHVEQAREQGKKSATHGEARKTAEYRTWAGIISRTTQRSVQSWKYYGGRGIKVCERWRHSYANFLTDMGRRLSPSHSIDRFPDTNGNYEPSNCRWATPKQQNENRRKRTRCFKGHLYTKTNTRFYRGDRICKKCRKRHARKATQLRRLSLAKGL